MNSIHSKANTFSPQKKYSIKRILVVEKYIMFPLKVIVILFSYYFISSLPASEETRYYFSQLKLYVVANIFFLLAIVGFSKNRIRPVMVKTGAFLLALIDNLYLSFLIYFTGGLDSELYMLYPGLLVRNAINFPKIKYQQTINMAFILFYIGAIYSAQKDFVSLTNEVFILRIVMLVLTSVCCWGIYFLVQRNKAQRIDNQERTIRSEKLYIASKLTGKIAHELKNPLGIINNAAYLIKKNAGENHEKIIRHADIIQQEVRKSDRIISELLDYSRLAAGKIAQVNINSFLSRFIKSNFSHITGIIFKLDENIPDLFIDENQLSQLIYHLITNALESVGINSKKQLIIAVKTLLAGDNNLNIIISDNGYGICEDISNQVFTPFFTTKNGHVGLGLSIVQNIAETYNGTVILESVKQEGTRVTVCLPVHTCVDEEVSYSCR